LWRWIEKYGLPEAFVRRLEECVYHSARADVGGTTQVKGRVERKHFVFIREVEKRNLGYERVF